MTIPAQEFLERWRSEEPLYLAWGKFVTRELSTLIKGRVHPTDLHLFLRMPVEPRIKTEDSLIQKAFYRKKSYEQPYDEIEDKVGVRFVVLLSEDIKIIEEAILNGIPFWDAVKARDFLEERAERPFEFDYQSLHYVVRSKLGHSFDGTQIPEGLPCEIQVRTLMQHAYSELTHDTIYKPSLVATPEMKRAAAKSMALIEATDDYFNQVASVIQRMSASYRLISETVSDLYEKAVGEHPVAGPLNSLLIDNLSKLTTEQFPKELEGFLEAKPFIASNVKDRTGESVLYRVPAILLVYFCASNFPNQTKNDSPLSDDELAPIYADLGMAL